MKKQEEKYLKIINIGKKLSKSIDDVNSLFSNRNLKYVDGYKQAIKDYQTKLIKLIK